MSDPELATAVTTELGRIDAADGTTAVAASDRVRRLVEAAPLPNPVVTAVAESYRELGRRCGHDDVPVAVRSSATAEDLPDASFAGQQDTFLWVRGIDEVLRAVRRCWSSVFTERALVYRHEHGFSAADVAMSVGIQQMVDAVSAGVAFTLHPSTGDRSQIAIESSWGLGESVVSGEVTPDDFVVDKVTGDIVGRSIAQKRCELVVADGAVRHAPVPADRVEAPSLTDQQVLAVADLARRAERHHGAPQDLEWALDRRAASDEIVLLQCRPETVWSQVPAPPVDPDADVMTSMIATLLAPIRRAACTAPNGS